MPKKKKKSRASSETTKSNAAEARGTPSSVRNKKSSPTPASTSKPELISDAISVRLLKGSSPSSSSSSSSSSSTGTKTLKYTPAVTLHETDANKLDVRVGDRVFVLSTTDSSPQRIKSIAIVSVGISDANSGRTATPKSSLFGGGGGGGKNGNHKKSKLAPGNCFLSPASLAEWFSRGDDDDEPEARDSDPGSRIDETPRTTAPDPSPIGIRTPSKPPPSSSSESNFSFAKGGGGDQPISPPPPQKPKPTPSSSSKSRFSFAQGGGGDQLISPRATAGNATPSSIRSKAAGPAKTMPLRIVPVDSDLGDSLVSVFCRTARVLSVGRHKHAMVPGEQESQPSSPESRPTLGGPLHRRLVVAHTCGEYLARGTPFSVSIQGRRVRCELRGASSHRGIGGEEKALIAAMTRLSIDPTATTGDAAIIERPADAACEVEKSLRASLSLLDDAQRENLLLYEVGPDTDVRFVTDDDDPPNDSNATTTTTTTADADADANADAKKSSPEPHKPKPMVAGLDGTIRRVVAALETPLLHPELFGGSASHLKPPRGILLHGPSGIGKSSLALQVGETFEATGAYHVERVHCTSLQTQTAFVGQAEARLARLFARAQTPRPGKKGCLLILDDVHLICPRREGIDLGADRLASTLLALLDGMTNGEPAAGERFYPAVVLAVTTNPGALDAALRRPGRLDSEIEVPLPDEPSARLEILRFRLESLGIETDFSDSEWISLARLAKGFTGADLELAAKEAVRNTLLSGGGRAVALPTIRKAILSTKPSAIKAVTVEVPSVPWTSIGGMETVKRQLRDAIELPLTHGETFRRLGIRPPRGVLLYGPPGCSKTLMARALATEGHMNFLAVKGPELLSKWLGESERALAALFRRARLASPAIIFFDEVDAIASKRGGSSNGSGERLLSQLLTELDGIQQQNGDSSGREGRVVIVCATNRPDLLDGALMRPGRIDRMIYVGVPDEKSREKILEIGLEKSSTGRSEIDIARLAKDDISGGLSGAELIGACRDAALKAMEEFEENENKNGAATDPIVTTDHVSAALTNAERQITPENLDFYASFRGNPVRH